MGPSIGNRTLKAVRVAPGLPAGGARYFPCPRTANRTLLCFSLCRPVDGMGECGRAAGHAQLGRTQLAILEYSRRPARARVSHDAPAAEPLLGQR
jgi:hypothetical protein